MRIIESLVHGPIRISIFSMNDKYLVKLEAGSYEQTYKVPHDDVEGLDDLKSKLNTDFLNQAQARFLQMNDDWRKALGTTAG